MLSPFLTQPSACTIYTDASANREAFGSAWALKVLAEDASELVFMEWLGGQAASSLGQLFNDTFNSTQADAVALAWTALAALQLPRDCLVDVVSDSDAARLASEAT